MANNEAEDVVVEDDSSEQVDQVTDDGKTPDKKTEPTVAELKAQLRETEKDRDRANERAAEATRNQDHWHEEAKAARSAKPVEKADKQPTLEEALAGIDLTEMVTAKDGPKRLVEFVTKHAPKGLSEGDVQKLINAKYDEAMSAGALANKFPDLNDPDSDFTKAVEGEMKILQNDPRFNKLNPIAMAEIAATRAELSLVQTGKRPAVRDPEAEREARIARQTSGGRTKAPIKARDEELTPDQKLACKKLGVSEADYIKSAKEGITMRRHA